MCAAKPAGDHWQMDEDFFVAVSTDILATNLGASKRIAQRVGYKVNEAKSSQGAQTVLVYLGFVLEIVRWSVCIKASTMTKLRHYVMGLRSTETCLRGYVVGVRR